MVNDVKPITVDEYNTYDFEQKKRYWEWRKRALHQDKIESRRIVKKMQNRYYNQQTPTLINAQECEFIKILKGIINDIEERKLIKFQRRKVFVEKKDQTIPK